MGLLNYDETEDQGSGTIGGLLGAIGAGLLGYRNPQAGASAAMQMAQMNQQRRRSSRADAINELRLQHVLNQRKPGNYPLHGVNAGNRYFMVDQFTGEPVREFPIEATPTAQLNKGIVPTADGAFTRAPGWGEANAFNKAMEKAATEGERRIDVTLPSGQPGSVPARTLDPAAYAAPDWAADLAESLWPRLMQVESGGNPNAVSPAGAVGLGQIMPATAANPGYGVAPLAQEDLRDPEKNSAKSKEYLAAMLREFGGNLPDALSAYNMGPGNVKMGRKNEDYVGKVLGAPKFMTDSEKAAAKARAEAQAKSGVELATDAAKSAQKKEIGAKNIMDMLSTQIGGKDVDALISEATGSGAGAARDATLNFFGQSSRAAEAANQLKTLEGWLTANVPRMEGPQSNYDVENYKQMASKIGDPTIPAEQKMAAKNALIDIMRRYSGPDGAGGQAGGGATIADDPERKEYEELLKWKQGRRR